MPPRAAGGLVGPPARGMPRRVAHTAPGWTALAVVALLSCRVVGASGGCPVSPGAGATLQSLGQSGTVRQSANVSAPVAVASGCTYGVRVPERTELSVTLPPPPRDLNARLAVDWDFDESAGASHPPVFVFSWGGQCCNGRHPHMDLLKQAVYGDFAFQPGAWSDRRVYARAEGSKQDIYHCGPGCITYRDVPNNVPLLDERVKLLGTRDAAST